MTGSADRGTNGDYTLSVNGTTLTGNVVTIPAGQSTVDVVLTARPDTQGNEGTETALFTVLPGNGYIPMPAMGAANVDIHTTPPKAPPDAVNDSITVLEDSGANPLAVLANDTTAPDIWETLSITSFTQAIRGTVTLVNGTLRYSPSADYFGSDQFTYTVSDGR